MTITIRTKTFRIFLTGALALVLIQAAPSAHAAEALAPEALIPIEAVVPIEASPAIHSYLLPGQLTSNALLPTGNPLPPRRSVEEMAAAERLDNLEQARNHAWRNRWMLSVVPLVASEALDASSSWGLRELNPVLAGSDGRFGMKATGIKFSVVGGLVGVEYLLVRKFPRSAKFFSIVNYSAAGITTGLAVHNYSLPGR